MTSPRVELFFESDSRNSGCLRCFGRARLFARSVPELFYDGCLKTPIYGLLEIVYN